MLLQPIVVVDVPNGIWSIISWVLTLIIPFTFLGLSLNSLGILKSTGKKVEQSEKEEKPFGETAKKGGRGITSVVVLMGGFVLTLLFILPRRVEFFNLLISLANGLLGLAGLDFRLPLLETI